MVGTAPVAERKPARAMAAAGIALILAASPAAPAPGTTTPPSVAAAGVSDQAATTSTYGLVDTWSDAPWRLTAGRYAHAADISSAPGGVVYVLDRRQQALHILGRVGRPDRVVALAPPDDGFDWTAKRIDVGFDGSVWLLSEAPDGVDGRYIGAVDRLTPDGRSVARFVVARDYNDIAAGPDGRLYLTRTQPDVPPTPGPRDPAAPPPKGAVDVLDPAGTRRASLDDRPLYRPVGVDVDADGTVYVLNRLPNPAGPDPGPLPTPLPSRAGGDDPHPSDAPHDTPPIPIPGVVIYAPDHAYRRTWPFNSAEDVAARPAGTFVSRNTEIFALDGAAPLWTGPTGQVSTSYNGGAPLHLDVTADGRLIASMAHCYFQGMLDFGAPDPSAARLPDPLLIGGLDRPDLAGPVYPLRIAATSSGLAVLQGRFTRLATGDPARPWAYRTWQLADQPQTIQQWSSGGALATQMGVCSGLATAWASDVSTAWWARGMAADGADVYTIDPHLVELRPDDAFPVWRVMPALAAVDIDPAPSPASDPVAVSRLTAIDAEGGRAAVLDAGAGVVHVIDRSGALAARWPYRDGGPGPDVPAVPVDIALTGDRVYLADVAGRRVVAYAAADGRRVAAWPVHDIPAAIAADAAGDVFVLGRGGWGMRYGPAGALAALWRMPDVAATALDLDVGADGRVFVAWVDIAAAPESSDPPMRALRRAGIWVFAPALPPPGGDPDLPPGGCLAAPDKTAAPGVIPLGATVEVRLTVAGTCPDHRTPAQVVLVVDTSRSMNADSALDRARDGVLALLARLDPADTEVGLVTFDDDAALEAVLGRDVADVAARVAALTAWGDSRLSAGLDAALAELTGERRDPAARPRIVVASDGDYKGSISPAVAAIKAAGIAVDVLVFPGRGYSGERAASLRQLLGDPGAVVVDPDAHAVARLADRLADARAEPGLFSSIAIRDVVPANMRYVAGSARPPAVFDAPSRTLTWTLASVAAADGIDLRYRLEPLEVGTWPTNVEATAAYRDATGSEGRLVFPVPRVKVWDRSLLVHRAWLPMIASGACLRPAVPLDVVLVIDASLSMTEPAASGGTKLDAARVAAGAFVDLLDPTRDHVAVVAFNSEATVHAGLIADRAAIRRGLGAIAAAAGTRIDRGLEAAAALAAGRRPSAAPVVVLLSDGRQAGPVEAVHAAAGGLRAGGARVYAIGLGDDVDRELLQAVATTPDAYFESPTAEDLARIYRAVSDRLACDVR